MGAGHRQSDDGKETQMKATASSPRPEAFDPARASVTEENGEQHARQEAGVSATNKWLVALAVILPTVLEVVDGTIVNVALPHIQGSLNASVDEVAWVVTSYLVANGVVIPMTGWLSGLFGRKQFFLLCIVLFTISSFLCGSAPNLPLLIFFRIIQGASGAAMFPLSQAILFETFPPKEHGIAMAVWGIGAMFGPIAGPLMGGWITDHYSWRWAFYVNVPLGALAFFLAWAFIHDPSYAKRTIRQIDYMGLWLLVVGLCCLQIVLDRGERADWFDATWVWVCSGISLVTLTALIGWELRTRAPIIDLRLLTNRNFAVGTFLHFMMGLILYAPLLLQPFYVQTFMGYDAISAGLIMTPGGIGTLIMMPMVGLLLNRVDARWLLFLGMGASCYSLLMMADVVTLETSMWQFIVPRLVWGLGMGFFFVPLSTASLGMIQKERMGDASALFNLMRNIGGSVGIALAVTLLSRRAQFHQNSLVGHITPYDPQAVDRFTYLRQGLMLSGADPVTAQTQAGQLIYMEVQRQSALMAFQDAFWLIGIIALACIPLVFLMRKFKGGMVVGH